MKSQYSEQVHRCATEWFKEHTATFSDVGGEARTLTENMPRFHHLRWKQPNTSNYWIDYILSGGFLLVYGDAGDAVYAWSENLTWDFLKSTDLDYFKSKGQASEVGRDYRQWDARKLCAELKCHMDECHIAPRYQDEVINCARQSMSADELHMNAQDYSHAWEKAFGGYYHEYIEWGWTINCRCVGHWVGIQMATGNTDEMLKRYEA